MASERRRSVLVVDDDASYRDALAVGLKAEGFFVYLAANGHSALRVFSDERPDVVLLDLRLPDVSGIDVCKDIRRISDNPILMLSAVGEEMDIVLSLELGADDYVPKPFRLRELVARIDSACRHHERARKAERRPPEVQGARTIGPFEIDFDARTVALDGKVMPMSRKEFDLVACLAQAPGRVRTREDLIQHVWGKELVDDRTLDTHMYRVRHTLEKDPARPQWIVSVRGVGFLLNDTKPDKEIASSHATGEKSS